METGLIERKGEKVTAALAVMVLAVVTGHPEIAVLAPLLQEGARRAFASTATRRLEKAIASRVCRGDAREARGTVGQQPLVGQHAPESTRIPA